MQSILQETGINERDICIIHESYWNQTAKFKLNHASQISNIRIGIRQECIFSVLLFNIYIEKICWHLKTIQRE
jgi:hypothetical protein